jgi:hypothetical protein
MRWIINTKKQVSEIKELVEESKKNKGKKWDEMTKKYKDLLISKGFFVILFKVWMFLGLLTFNWFIFLFIIIFNFLIIAPISKIIKRFNKAYVTLYLFNSIIGFILGVFVIVNSYHLKINTYEYFLQWFNSI